MNDTDRVIDLNAARAKRFESYGDPPTVTVADQSFTLPHEMPWRLVRLWEGETVPFAKVLEGLQLLLGPEWERFLAADVSPSDMAALVEQVYELYADRSRKRKTPEEAPPTEPTESPEGGGGG